MHLHPRKANDVYAYAKDAHNSHAIFQSRKTRKFIKNKRFEIFEFCQLKHLLKNMFLPMVRNFYFGPFEIFFMDCMVFSYFYFFCLYSRLFFFFFSLTPPKHFLVYE